MLQVLLVEDNPGDVLLVREAIRSASLDVDVLVACDGEQALRFLAQHNVKPDMVLLDLNVPKFSGLEILERYGPKTGPPFIVLTSSANPFDKERAVALGACEYLEKPLDLSSYIKTVHGAIERWTDKSNDLNLATGD